MTDHYAQLTDAEKAHWDEYTRLRELSDWPGFTDGQDQRRAAARSWLVEQRKFIWRCAEGKETPEYPAGWDRNQRSERYAQLKDESLNSGACRRVASLPREGATDSERALLAERCTSLHRNEVRRRLRRVGRRPRPVHGRGEERGRRRSCTRRRELPQVPGRQRRPAEQQPRRAHRRLVSSRLRRHRRAVVRVLRDVHGVGCRGGRFELGGGPILH
jgi:hypothetical protein